MKVAIATVRLGVSVGVTDIPPPVLPRTLNGAVVPTPKAALPPILGRLKVVEPSPTP